MIEQSLVVYVDLKLEYHLSIYLSVRRLGLQVFRAFGVGTRVRANSDTT